MNDAINLQVDSTGVMTLKPSACAFLVSETVERIIDFDKVQTLDDVKNILRGLNISVYDNGGEHLEALRPYLKPKE